MKPLSSRVFLAFVAVAPMAAAVVMANGCGGIDCMETATCLNVDDGSSDQSAMSIPDAFRPEGASDQAATGADASEAGDDVKVDDATVDADDATLDDSAASEAGDDVISEGSSAVADADAGKADSADGADAADAGDARDAPGVAPDASDGCIGAGGPENCTNGIDDNCDGLVDCADPQCQSGYACVVSAPAGWFGPGALYDGLSAPPPPACSAPFPNDAFNLNSTPSSPAPSCACACGGVTGGCTNPVVTVFSDNQCGATNSCGFAGASACTVADGTNCSTGGQSAHVTLGPQPTSTGSCPSSVTTLNVPASTWARAGEACTSSRSFVTGGCTTGSVCADKPSATFQPKLCIWKNADTDCTTVPAYPLLFKYYSNTIDTRQCAQGTCACAAASGVSCSLTGATAFRSPNCDGGAMPITTLGGVCNVFSADSVLAVTTTVSVGGSCSTTGSSTTSGTVTPDSTTAVTVCCSQ